MLLKLEKIGKIYDSNDILTVGIRGIDLAFDYNELTLLNVIGANDTYEEGELYFNGEPTSHYSESDWEKYREKNIATIFQDFNIIENLTVRENVELALFRLNDVKERRKVADELIAKVGLTKQANQRGSKLSGGEKQRTVIARALAKDSPIILADEPTGNLDVKSSREIAKLLKDVSKDKLVIVVTHNPEFFKEYATRRIRVFDGQISEDRLIEKPTPRDETAATDEAVVSRLQVFKNTLHIGILNYKSRPKFTSMMTLALFVCAITLFIVISLFGQSLIQPTTTPLDGVGVEGKVILSAESNITADDLDVVASETEAGYILFNRELSEFTVTVPRGSGMLQAYEVTCIYAPYAYNLAAGSAVLVLPVSCRNDAGAIEEVSMQTTFEGDGVYLYLSHADLTDYGKKMQAINSVMRLGEDEATVYTFEVGESVETGSVNLINSNYYAASGRTVVFTAKADKSYTVVDTSEKREDVSGLIVQMNAEDYAAMFAASETVAQSALYYSSDDIARSAVDLLPDGYMGMLSTSSVYVTGAGDVFTSNILWYLVLIAVSLLFAVLISVIFMRSVKIYKADFAVYRTLGISSKISSRSLYIQMLFIFLPTLVLLPLVSLIATVIPGSGLAFISVGNYFFIEIMMLLIVEFVAFGFNRSIKGQSIRKSLRRGSK